MQQTSNIVYCDHSTLIKVDEEKPACLANCGSHTTSKSITSPNPNTSNLGKEWEWKLSGDYVWKNFKTIAGHSKLIRQSYMRNIRETQEKGYCEKCYQVHLFSQYWMTLKSMK